MLFRMLTTSCMYMSNEHFHANLDLAFSNVRMCVFEPQNDLYCAENCLRLQKAKTPSPLWENKKKTYCLQEKKNGGPFLFCLFRFKISSKQIIAYSYNHLTKNQFTAFLLLPNQSVNVRSINSMQFGFPVFESSIDIWYQINIGHSTAWIYGIISTISLLFNKLTCKIKMVRKKACVLQYPIHVESIDFRLNFVIPLFYLTPKLIDIEEVKRAMLLVQNIN